MSTPKYTPSIAAYHCNDKDRCEKFVHDGDLVWSEENGIWLGSGMYFWDTLCNANYWKSKKEEYDRLKKYIVIEAWIALDHVLDLTDYDIANRVEEVWRTYCEILKYDINQDLGFKLNFLFEHKKEFATKYYVIKILGKYNRVRNNNLFTYNVHSFKCEPTLSVRCIYSVRNSECILNRSLMK